MSGHRSVQLMRNTLRDAMQPGSPVDLEDAVNAANLAMERLDWERREDARRARWQRQRRAPRAQT